MERVIGMPGGHSGRVLEVVRLKVRPIEEIMGFLARWAPGRNPEDPVAEAIERELTDLVRQASPVPSNEEGTPRRLGVLNYFAPERIVQ
jgi:hypothetical protein